jgi:hypothetical protein
MKNIKLVIIVSSFLLFIQTTVHADLPSRLNEATQAYKNKGVESFIPTLLKGSPLEGEKTVFSQVNSLKQIETFYGTYLNVEHLLTKNLSKSTRIVYYILNYEKGPVYGVATLYKSKDGEIVTQFNVHTTIQSIIPDSILVNIK